MAVNWKKNLCFIWLSQILTLAGFAAAMPFIPIFMRDKFGVTDVGERGIYVSIFYFVGMSSFCIATPLWGVLADRYGRKLMLLRANFVSSLLFPLLAWSPNIWALIAIRFVASIFTGTVNAAQSLVVATTPEEHHGVALGILSSALWSGNMIGFLAGGIIVNYCGYLWAFLLCGALFFTGGVLVWLFVHEDFTPVPPKPAATGRAQSGNWLTGMLGGVLPFGVPLMLVLFGMMAVARRFDEPFLALQVEVIGGFARAAYHTGIISAAAAAGGILSGLFIGRLCDRFNPGMVAVIALLTACGSMAVEALAWNLWIFGAARFLCFFAAGGLEPAFQTMLSHLSPPERRGTLFGLAASVRTLGILLSSLLGLGVVSFLGTRGIFFTGAAMFLATLPVLIVALKQRQQQRNGQ